MKIPNKYIAPIVTTIYSFWCNTLKYIEINRNILENSAEKYGSFILALWHNELFSLMKTRRDLHSGAIVSQSRDGDFLATCLERMNIKAARGSSSRGGFKALRQAVKMIKDEKRIICITVDGPRGPRHQVKEGPIYLSRLAKVPIIPVRIHLSKYYEFKKAWDKFQLPLPFSTVRIVYGQPYCVSETKLEEKELKIEQDKLKNQLDNLLPYDN